VSSTSLYKTVCLWAAKLFIFTCI